MTDGTGQKVRPEKGAPSTGSPLLANGGAGMPLDRTTGPAATNTGLDVGLVIASAAVPETFAPSLAARGAVDQGVVTGLSVGLHYLLTVGAQDTLQALAAELA